jgi:hypothetical protein
MQRLEVSGAVRHIYMSLGGQRLNYSNILAEEQFRFRKNLTTQEASYELSNEMVSALNYESVQGGILCDITKIFSSVKHDTLLSILNFY